MANGFEWNFVVPFVDRIPGETLRGPGNALLMVLRGLHARPSNFRLLRGLTPWLDTQDASHVFLLTQRKRKESWKADAPLAMYWELAQWEPFRGIYRGMVHPGEDLDLEELFQDFRKDPLELIDRAAARAGAAVVSNVDPLPLETQEVLKPWGKEIWYTGVEKRGVSRVVSETGTTELPYALGLFPEPLTGVENPNPILLKILDPLPEDPRGNLYLEVHREKWEAYVVLNVHPDAWPSGTGSLLAGLDQALLERFRKESPQGWEEKLREHLNQAIGQYEQVRGELDQRAEEGTAPAELLQREHTLRKEVEAMFGQVPLAPGAVILLPAGVIHSLRHGVRVVEFQTPTYERLIAMAGQRVLTQNHWDTAAALEQAVKAPYHLTEPLLVREEDGLRVDLVVDFPEFNVERHTLASGSQGQGRTRGGTGYQLLFVVEGEGKMILPGNRNLHLAAGSAFLLPAGMGSYRLWAGEKGGFTCLVASPKDEAPLPSA
ncbi:MAG: hypothetical protein OEV94_11425 [Deltaproteobacteria bacterium]|nr:hypothetical protein [Deltaproteobacteria bacterium]